MTEPANADWAGNSTCTMFRRTVRSVLCLATERVDQEISANKPCAEVLR
jgi:hypothetical protein